MKDLFKRHNLVEISSGARQVIYSSISERYCGASLSGELKKMFLEGYSSCFIPGIVRRQDDKIREGYISLGFASLNKFEGSRLRIPFSVRLDDVVRVTGPYEVVLKQNSRRTACLAFLADVCTAAEDSGLEIGVWGSAAMELYTGLPYTTEGSDLDLIVKPGYPGVLKDFYETIKTAGRKHNVRVDAELDLPDGGSVKLEEFFMSSGTLLSRSLYEVELIRRESLMKTLGMTF